MAFGKAKVDLDAMRARASVTDAQKRAVLNGADGSPSSRSNSSSGWAVVGSIAALSFTALVAKGLMAAGVVANPFGGGAANPGVRTTFATTDMPLEQAAQPANMQTHGRALAARYGVKSCRKYTEEELQAEVKTMSAAARKLQADAAEGNQESVIATALTGAGTWARGSHAFMCAHRREQAEMKARERQPGESRNAHRLRLKRLWREDTKPGGRLYDMVPRRGESRAQFKKRLQASIRAKLNRPPSHTDQRPGESDNAYSARSRQAQRVIRNARRRLGADAFKRRAGEPLADFRKRERGNRKKLDAISKKAWR